MKKEILTFTLASAIISLPALAGTTYRETTRKTTMPDSQERMEDTPMMKRSTTKKTTYPEREVREKTRKTRTTTRETEDLNDINDY